MVQKICKCQESVFASILLQACWLVVVGVVHN